MTRVYGRKNEAIVFVKGDKKTLEKERNER